MNVGKLNKRVELQVNSEETSTYTTTLGGLSTTWATETTVWASIEPLNARESLIAQQSQSDIDTRIRIRYYSSLTTRYRIKYGTRYFQIISAINPSEKNEEWELLCKEIK